MIAADTFGSGFQRLPLHRRQAVEGSLEQILAEFEIGHGVRCHAVEAARVVEYRGVANSPHIVQDLGNRAFDGLVGNVVEMQQRVERRQELGLAAGQASDGHCTALAKLSITGWSRSRFSFRLA